MVNINVPNVITITLIAIAGIVVVRFAFKALGKASPV